MEVQYSSTMHIDYHSFLQNTRYSIWCFLFSIYYRLDRIKIDNIYSCNCTDPVYGKDIDSENPPLSFHYNEDGLINDNCCYNPTYLSEYYLKYLLRKEKNCYAAEGYVLDRVEIENFIVNLQFNQINMDLIIKTIKSKDYINHYDISDLRIIFRDFPIVTINHLELQHTNELNDKLIGSLHQEIQMREQLIFQNNGYICNIKDFPFGLCGWKFSFDDLIIHFEHQFDLGGLLFPIYENVIYI